MLIKNNVKIFVRVFLLVLLLPAASLFAQNAENSPAVIREVSGTAYISNSSGVWREAVKEGTIVAGERILTGHRSRMVLVIGQDEILLEGYTDIMLQSIRGSDVEETRVAISSGGIRAKVRTSTGERNRDRFTVRSPLATASVRGTDFDFNGTELVVYEGDVQLRNSLGQKHSVRAGQESSAYGVERITSVEDVLKESALIDR